MTRFAVSSRWNLTFQRVRGTYRSEKKVEMRGGREFNASEMRWCVWLVSHWDPLRKLVLRLRNLIGITRRTRIDSCVNFIVSIRLIVKYETTNYVVAANTEQLLRFIYRYPVASECVALKYVYSKCHPNSDFYIYLHQYSWCSWWSKYTTWVISTTHTKITKVTQLITKYF